MSAPACLPRRLYKRRTGLPVPVLVYLLLIMVPLGFEIGPLYITGTRLLLAVMAAPLAICLLYGRYGPVLVTDVLFVFHILWIALALAINNPEEAIENAGSQGVEFLGGYLMGRAYIRDRQTFIALIKLLTWLIIGVFPLAVFEAFTGLSVLINLSNQLPGVTTPIDLSIDRRMGLERVQLAFEHPIHWGLFCTLATSLYFVGRKPRHALNLRILVIGVLGLGCLFSLSSGAILAFALQIGLILWGYFLRKFRQKWLLLTCLFLLAYFVVDMLSNRGPLQVFMTYATFSAQSAYWRSAIFEWGVANVWANPYFGLGLNDWMRPVWMHTPSIDNFWLLIAMRFGLPAFAFLVGGYVYALWKIGQRNFSQDRVLLLLRRAWVYCFVGLSFALATVHIWGTIYGVVFFFFGSGMWMFAAKPIKSSGRYSQTAINSNRFSRLTEAKF